MLRNYLKIALRSLLKHKVFSVVTIVGLAVGMAVCLLIVQYVQFEQSYDRQSPHADQIWRVYVENYSNGTLDTRDANTHSAVGPTLKAELPEVVDYTRVYSARELTVIRNKTPYAQSKAYAVDPSFLRLFPYRVLRGNAMQGLSQPGNMVLTASVANKYFGNSNPVGQTLQLVGGWFSAPHTVAAVIEDVPLNTHFKFDMLLPYQTLYSQGHKDNWENYWDYNYIQLHPQANAALVQAKLTELSKLYLSKSNLVLNMQPLTDIHLRSDLTYEHEPNGSARMVYFLLLIAAFILGIAWINYSNLTTARAMERAKEVGLRKAIGANRWQMMGQFLGEAVAVNLLAIGLAILLMQLAGPAFNQLTYKPLNQSTNLPALAGLFVISVLGSGFYPAVVLSGYEPMSMLRGSIGRFGKGLVLRKSLVVFQLVCTVVMLAATVTIYRQIDFLQHHDLGVSIDQMLVLKAPRFDYNQDSVYRNKYEVFKAEVAKLPHVQRIAASSVVPGEGINAIGGTSDGVFWKKRITNNKQTFYFVNVDEPFMRTYGVRQLAGRGLEADQPQWRNQYLINRSALKAMGFPSPEAAVGEAMVFGGEGASRGNDMRIIGVIDDFHIESLKLPTRPTLYMCPPATRMAYFSVKLGTQQLPGTIERLNQLWKQLYPDSPFEYFFLDQRFDEQYRAERQFQSIFTVFTGLAILVACLGLFGLATFTAEQRTKEIGVRKVLGASVPSLVSMLNKDFLNPVLMAILIATPIAWYAMDQWLQNFTYRINLDWWIFALAGLLAVVIALFTVSFQSVRAALMNPVKSLRSE
ncbi:ABC transporter permease [Nibrella saemangeumensis]|uniref:ABC transporter permease n=1 Tax=Nibrella saemangeumensis TaxID=1084526 RepID=A0ABP8N5Q3_9BACT